MSSMIFSLFSASRDFHAAVMEVINHQDAEEQAITFITFSVIACFWRIFHQTAAFAAGSSQDAAVNLI
jgi:hypothetical protein